MPHSKRVKAWVDERRDKIELFYLPSYKPSPELNPEERCNAGPKYAIGSKAPTRTKDKLKAAATAHREALEQTPEHVKKHFQDPRTKYAA